MSTGLDTNNGCTNIQFTSNNNNSSIQNTLNLDPTVVKALQQQMLLLQQQQQQQQQFQPNASFQALIQQIQLNTPQQQQQQQLFPTNFLSLPIQQQSPFSFGLQQQFNQQMQSQQQQQSQYSQMNSSLLNTQLQLLLSNNFPVPNPVQKTLTQTSQMIFTPAVKEEEQDENDLEDQNIPNQQDNEDDDQITAGQELCRRSSSLFFRNGFQPLSPNTQLQQLLKQQQLQNKHLQDTQCDERARSATTLVYFPLNPLNEYQKMIFQSPAGITPQNFTPQQLPTQQLFQMHLPSSTQLPEFQLGGTSNTSIQTLEHFTNLRVGHSQSSQEPTEFSAEQVKQFKQQMGISVRDKETLAPFLQHWNSKQETQQVLDKSYSLLKSFSREGSAEYENEFHVEYLEDSQKCNYVNKFINSKGLIVKDEKFGKIKIENKISRFHNLSRLLMYTILTAFHKNNLALMNLDTVRQEAIIKMIQHLKQSARKKTPKGLIKTDFFNHTHYNVLFLTINEHNIDQVRKNQKDISTHQKVFNINLELPLNEISEDLRYSNIIKKLAYHIMLASYKKSKDDKRDSDLSNSSNSTYREQYIDRAMVGIGKLNQGVLIQRF